MDLVGAAVNFFAAVCVAGEVIAVRDPKVCVYKGAVEVVGVFYQMLLVAFLLSSAVAMSNRPWPR